MTIAANLPRVTALLLLLLLLLRYPHKQEDGKMNMHTSQLILERLTDPAYLARYPQAAELTAWTADVRASVRPGMKMPGCLPACESLLHYVYDGIWHL